MSSAPRIALCGFILESNAFAPVATEADFRGRYYLEGEAILDQAVASASVMPMEMTAFVRAMQATGPWSPVPLVLTGYQPWGPVDSGFFNRTMEAIVARITDAGPIDGVYVANHGGMTATDDFDPDGDMLSRIRQAVGPDVPIIATLDLVGYQTNPHVDMAERGEEAAFLMRLLLSGVPARQVFLRLPIVAPSVTLLTANGPYGALMDLAQRRKRELGGAILNASVFGGFAFSDTPKNGLAIVITSRGDRAVAVELAAELAEVAWNAREGFRKKLVPIEDGVALALKTAADPSAPAVIFSDAGDNPGGGGGGDTTYLLKALSDAGAKGVYFGSFFDPALAAEAHALGEGATFSATFNREQRTAHGERLDAASEELQVSRLMHKRQLSEAASKQRIAAQSSQTGKLRAATVVIRNDGSFENTWEQVQSAWADLPKPKEPLLEQPPDAEPGQLMVRRGRPQDADDIARFITQVTHGKKSMSRSDVMAAFGEKAFLLIERDSHTAGVAGWQVENLVTRIDELYFAPNVPLDEAIPALMNSVETASNELQSEASLLFLPPYGSSVCAKTGCCAHCSSPHA